MEKAFIFDFDGTLYDSYPSIVEHLSITFKELGFIFEDEYIYKEIVKASSVSFIEKVCKENNLFIEETKRVYDSFDSNLKKIVLYKTVKETLIKLKENGNYLFIFTHRGDSTHYLLKRDDINNLFTDVITSKDGFNRKPNPAAIEHLIKKYNLNRLNTYYVGDREIDLMCAKNADVKSIFYNTNDLSFDLKADIEIKEFSDILSLK